MNEKPTKPESSLASTKPARAGCVAPARPGEPERSDGSGLVGFNEQSDSPTVVVAHSEAQKRRCARMALVVKGAAIQMQRSLQQAGYRYRAGLVTVTYARDDEWEPNHIRELTHHYRRWFKRRGEAFRCIWVAELTKRGRVHYHLVFFARRGLTPPKPDAQGWWRHGSSNCVWARRPVGYICKYASKGSGSGLFPKGCRLYGVSGQVGFLGWFRAPKWARNLWTPGDNILRIGEFWTNRTLGVAVRSPWVYDRSTSEGIILRWVGWTSDDVLICLE